MTTSLPKLTYFDQGGRAESIRIMLAHANFAYNDNRFAAEDWPTMQATTPMGGVPLWEEDGYTMCQTNSILRQLGIRLGYYPEDPDLAYNADSLCDFIEDDCQTAYMYIAVLMETGANDPEIIKNYYKKKMRVVDARL